MGMRRGSTPMRAVVRVIGLVMCCGLLLSGCARQPGGVSAELSHSSADVVGAVASTREGLAMWRDGRTTRQHVRVLTDDMTEQALAAYGTVVNLDVEDLADEPMRDGTEAALSDAVRVIVAARAATMLDRLDAGVGESVAQLDAMAERLQRIVDDPRSAARPPG